MNSVGLGVLPTDVVNAADRRYAAERAVWSALVVVAQPVWQCGRAVSRGAVAHPVGPLAGHRLVEAFDSPMSSVECWCGFGPGVEAAVDDVCEMAFEGAACLAWR